VLFGPHGFNGPIGLIGDDPVLNNIPDAIVLLPHAFLDFEQLHLVAMFPNFQRFRLVMFQLVPHLDLLLQLRQFRDLSVDDFVQIADHYRLYFYQLLHLHRLLHCLFHRFLFLQLHRMGDGFLLVGDELAVDVADVLLQS
jgi:hypothetical protein